MERPQLWEFLQEHEGVYVMDMSVKVHRGVCECGCVRVSVDV